jgi:penicillin-insensitive murein endopeptidase
MQVFLEEISQVLIERTVLCLMMTLLCGAVAAQDVPWFKSTVEGSKRTPAKELFGSVTAPAPLAARAIGSYSRGCLAGGIALPINGRDWRVMRFSRNRNWGHPRLIAYLERLAKDAPSIGWPGSLAAGR